jgi:glycerol-3-phosphate dehydrogenase
MMRDLRRLADTRFDLVVVGAGFYGAIAAWDATLRGLSVALIDQDDFGAATSFNNLKTLHGGLRSLQSGNFAQMRLFIRERRALARVAPHLVQPLPFVVPTYHQPTRSAALMRVALAINDAVARDRHDGLDPALRLPASAVISRDECLRRNPAIAPDGVTGGALWHDYRMHNTDRMTFSFVLSAATRGAVTANYVRADSLLRDGGRAGGVRAQDRLTSESFDIRATTVLNAGGPWAASFLESLSSGIAAPAHRLSRAMNVVVGRVAAANGCGGLARGRFLFLIPWRDVSLVGTSHDAHEGPPGQLRVTRDDVETFLADARQAFPCAGLATEDIRLVHRGLLPMVSGDSKHVRLLRESAVVDHRKDGAAGLISMFGVRYTTARQTAETAIDAVFAERGSHDPPRSQTATTPVSGGDIADKERFLASAQSQESIASPETRLRLASTYGTTYGIVMQIIGNEPHLAMPLGDRCAVTGAEIAHAIRSEAAVKLSDALIRRTEAGSAGHPGDDAIRHAAAIMAGELGWDESQIANEVREAEDFYRLPT